MSNDFSHVTERSGEPATPGQIADMFHRYQWASAFCRDRRVLEVACGTGQGLGLLAETARSVVGCDIDPESVAIASKTYGTAVRVVVASADRLPVENGSLDVVLLFEALYYLPNVTTFFAECRRTLAPGGVLLLSTTNPDLYDFSPSPLSQRYYGGGDLPALLGAHGFSSELFGYARTDELPLRHRLLRPAKAAARGLGLVPKTMKGKALVRRALFGPLPRMPATIADSAMPYVPPRPIDKHVDRSHRFLYVVAQTEERG